jgi:hypothetical protein
MNRSGDGPRDADDRELFCLARDGGVGVDKVFDSAGRGDEKASPREGLLSSNLGNDTARVLGLGGGVMKRFESMALDGASPDRMRSVFRCTQTYAR